MKSVYASKAIYIPYHLSVTCSTHRHSHILQEHIMLTVSSIGETLLLHTEQLIFTQEPETLLAALSAAGLLVKS